MSDVSPWKFSRASERHLATVKPALQAVIRRALQISPVDFGVTEGLRSPLRQRELLAAGATRTLDSKHLTGDAVDVAAYVGGKVRWDWPLYARIATAVKLASDELQTPVRWGGDWGDFKDGPHFELVRPSK